MDNGPRLAGRLQNQKTHPRVTRVRNFGPKKTPKRLTGPIKLQKSAKKAMEEVKKLLHLARLPTKEKYDVILEQHGYDDIDFLLQLGPHELEIVKGLTNMKEGHFMRLQKALQYWRDNVVTVTVTSSGGDLNDDVLRHSTGHSALPPRAAPSSESTTGPSSVGPTSSMAGPEVSGSHGPITDESIPATSSATAAAEVTAEATQEEIPMYFQQGYAEWKTARLMSLNHSTQMGCSCCQDNRRSGSRYKVLICRSMGPKRSREDMESSGQKVTQFELVYDPEFVKHVTLEKNTTGKKAADSSLGNCGRMAGSVKDFTARRARNQINNWNHKDYNDDFCKLRPWGRAYERLNTGARFRFCLEPGTNK